MRRSSLPDEVVAEERDLIALTQTGSAAERADAFERLFNAQHVGVVMVPVRPRLSCARIVSVMVPGCPYCHIKPQARSSALSLRPRIFKIDCSALLISSAVRVFFSDW